MKISVEDILNCKVSSTAPVNGDTIKTVEDILNCKVYET
jgi:hypothetical protein